VPVTYGNYLKLEELLDLQVPQSDGPEGPEHDELLFIVIHQVYELWFKLVLHELALVQKALESGDTPGALETFKRILTIFKTLVGQVDILETMTPVSFLSFRDRLDMASGFQSVQFREVEFVLGARSRALAAHYPPAKEQLDRRLGEPSLYDSFLRYLVARGYPVPEETLERDRAEPPGEHPEIHPILVDIYHHDPATREICERMVDLDEGVQEWRYRHVKMVERTIGEQPGTGGSAGVAYLRSTLFQPAFPDLWAIRARLEAGPRRERPRRAERIVALGDAVRHQQGAEQAQAEETHLERVDQPGREAGEAPARRPEPGQAGRGDGLLRHRHEGPQAGDEMEGVVGQPDAEAQRDEGIGEAVGERCQRFPCARPPARQPGGQTEEQDGLHHQQEQEENAQHRGLVGRPHPAGQPLLDRVDRAHHAESVHQRAEGEDERQRRQVLPP